MRLTASLLILASAIVSALTSVARNDDFDWGRSTVYFVITDRFCNGDTTNDNNYGRITDYGSERLNAATFHGGDFKGLLSKAKDGYFRDLGVDVVWMTDVYEQIHGWMTGSGAVNDFPHYGYHGYYPLDYTQTDKNYGTISEFRELVDTLHSQGIRVMLGANLNDPGYPTLLDAVQYGFADTGLTEAEASAHRRSWSYDDFFAGRLKWKGWYDRNWIRMPDEPWDENDPLQATLYGMPDFKDESDEPADIPAFLHRKWAMEGDSNDAWVNPSARELRSDRRWSPMQYVVAWIASWVEEFGIDGFRCDIVENVRTARWAQLHEACDSALARWRRRHPESPASEWNDAFYMTGDFSNASVDFKPCYADAGFSSMVNCFFPKRGDLDNIVYTWQAYSDSVAAHDDWHPFSYLNNSYHRDTEGADLIDCATTLMLSPGTVQVFYGDESGRRMSEARLNVDAAQAFRSDMNWNDTDSALLRHYQRLGSIRKQNPVIASGRQRTLGPHTCVRYDDADTIIICLKPDETGPVDVSGVFADGEVICDLYSGAEATVADGRLVLPACGNNVAVLRRKWAGGISGRGRG